MNNNVLLHPNIDKGEFTRVSGVKFNILKLELNIKILRQMTPITIVKQVMMIEKINNGLNIYFHQYYT